MTEREREIPGGEIAPGAAPAREPAAENCNMPVQYVETFTAAAKRLNLDLAADVLYNEIGGMLSAGGKNPVTNSDIVSFITYCREYNLNPLTRQIFGFMQAGKLTPVISVDGWAKIANDAPNYNGYNFTFGEMKERTLTFRNYGKTEAVKRLVADYIKCDIFLKNREHPVTVITFFDEAYQQTPVWAQQPMQMLQNRAFARAVRKAFGVAFAYTADEASQITGGSKNDNFD